MAVSFCPVASGSSGNCLFFASDHTRLIIDAGLSGIRIEKSLFSIGVDLRRVDGIFITHEHADHIQGAGILSRRYGMPVYATPGTWEEMDRHNMLGKISPGNRLYVYPGEDVILNDVVVRPFAIPHDAVQPVGYSFATESGKVSVATDLGYVSDTVRENLRDSHIIFLESNHDEEMLINGSYPQQLKRRIMSKSGHLSNISAGKFLKEMTNTNTLLKYVYLGHLSEENNRPILAYETVRNIVLSECPSPSFEIYMAERYRAGKMTVL